MAYNPNSPYSLLDSYYQFQMTPPAKAQPAQPKQPNVMPTPQTGMAPPPLPDFFNRPGPSIVIQSPDRPQSPTPGTPPAAPNVPTPPPLPPDAQNRLLQAMSLQGLLGQFMGMGQGPDNLGIFGQMGRRGFGQQFSSLIEPGIQALFNQSNVMKNTMQNRMQNPGAFSGPYGMGGQRMVMDPQILQIAASLINQIIQSGGGMANA